MNQQEDQFQKEHTQFIDEVFKMVVFVFLVAVLAIAAYVFWFRSHKISTDPTDWGAFGDYLGGLVNPAVGLITVLLIVISISMQRKELHNSLVEMKAANRAAIKMSFEQSLFTWLENYHDQIKSIECEGWQGRKALLHIYNSYLAPHRSIAFIGGEEDPSLSLMSDYEANQFYLRYLPEFKPSDQMNNVQFHITLKYASAYLNNKSELDSPFRTFYRLMKWIDGSELSNVEKWHYCTLIRSQLSWPELVCLYYNCLIKEGEKLAYYANKYALFDNLDVSDELIRYAINVLSIQSHDERLNKKDAQASWPFFSRAFNSSEAKASLGLALEL